MKVALLGCGRIARLAHLEALRAMPGVRVVAVADSDAARLAEAGKRAAGAEPFSDYAEALRGADADAVVITLPPALHAEAAIAAFRAGRHVYLEKPLAVQVEEAAPVLEAWRASGRVGMIGFNYRLHPAIARARQVLASGALGRLVAVRSAFTAAPREQPTWKRARATGGGALLNLASHHVDLVQFLTGEPISEAGAERHAVHSEDDTALLSLRLRSGVPVQSFFSLVAAQQDRWEFLGTAATLRVDRYADEIVVEPAAAPRVAERVRRALAIAARTLGRSARRLHEPSHRAALEQFAGAVRNGRQIAPDLDDGLRSLLVLATGEAAGPAAAVVPEAMAPVPPGA